MTIQELEDVRSWEKHVKALEFRISTLAGAIPSGSGGGHSSEPGNPTEKNAMKIIELREEISFIEHRVTVVDDWIKTISDPQVRTIAIYARCGKTWSEIAALVYGGISDKGTAYNRLKRFLENDNKDNATCRIM